MARVEVQKVPARRSSKRDIFATVCYYYPQYTLVEASHLPARDINLLIKTARRMEASRNYDLTQIAAAPHTKKGAGVKQLSEHYNAERNK